MYLARMERETEREIETEEWDWVSRGLPDESNDW